MRFEAAADWGPPAGTPPMLQDGVKDTRDGSWVVRSISSADARWYAAVLSARYIDAGCTWRGRVWVTIRGCSSAPVPMGCAGPIRCRSVVGPATVRRSHHSHPPSEPSLVRVAPPPTGEAARPLQRWPRHRRPCQRPRAGSSCLNAHSGRSSTKRLPRSRSPDERTLKDVSHRPAGDLLQRMAESRDGRFRGQCVCSDERTPPTAPSLAGPRGSPTNGGTPSASNTARLSPSASTCPACAGTGRLNR